MTKGLRVLPHGPAPRSDGPFAKRDGKELTLSDDGYLGSAATVSVSVRGDPEGRERKGMMCFPGIMGVTLAVATLAV